MKQAAIASVLVFAVSLGWAPEAAQAQWVENGPSIVYTDDNVGIGTTSPTAKLTIGAPTGTALSTTFATSAGVLGTTAGNELALGSIGFASGNSSMLGIRAYRTAAGTDWTTTAISLGMDVDNTLRAGANIWLHANGNVGIGTTGPTAKLHIAGDVRVDGNIAAKYQDVAEWVPARRAMSAGTVVVLDVQHSNQVQPSAHAYDTKVAGVVSAMPGILLGEAGEGKVKVATTGRVKVKVDASQQPIRVGDLLVTSETEGVAMRSEPLDLGGVPIHRPGTLIGKALEPLPAGHGDILVLLSLQ